MRADLGRTDPISANLAQRSCVDDILTRAAALFPERTAPIVGDTEYAYSQLEARVNGG